MVVFYFQQATWFLAKIMGFDSFVPKNNFLKKWIAYYYTDGSEKFDYRNSYLFYPHIYTTLSFYQNAEFREETGGNTIFYAPNIKYLKLVTQQTLPRCTTQIGKTNKIAIAFKPLGLNHFIKENYARLVPRQVQIFAPQNDSKWNELLEELFVANSIKAKTEILDNFLVRQFNGYENDLLKKAVEILSDINNKSSIDEIAASLHISRRTLLRYFKSELRVTPELFRSIVRFRFAISEKIVKNSNESLTKIAHEANFFDQAYFIKCFKRFTGVTPHQFFRQGTRIGQEDTFWTFNPQKT